jgi:hypothetical protein
MLFQLDAGGENIFGAVVIGVSVRSIFTLAVYRSVAVGERVAGGGCVGFVRTLFQNHRLKAERP